MLDIGIRPQNELGRRPGNTEITVQCYRCTDSFDVGLFPGASALQRDCLVTMGAYKVSY